MGAYKGWPDSKANGFLDELVQTVEERRIHPVSSAIVVDSFNKLSHNQRRFLTGGTLWNGKFRSSGCPSKPYFVPFQNCIIDAAGHAPVGGKAHFFFDLNKNFEGYALDLFAIIKKTVPIRERIGDIDFLSGVDTAPLQTADLLSYQSYQYALKLLANRSERVPHVLKRLLRGLIPRTDTFLDDKGLQALLEGVSIPPDDT